jgi:hypothetical protein
MHGHNVDNDNNIRTYLQDLEEYESAMEQVYQKLVDVYNGEGWLSQDGTLLTTSIAETAPFADSG